LGLTVDYMLRVAMSTAAQKPPPDASSAAETMYTEFGWSDSEQGLILGSFYIGYTLTQIPGSFLATNPAVGPAKTVFWGMMGASISSLMTPLVAGWPWILAVVRILCGLSEGVVYPGLAVLMQRWAPPLERSRMTTFMCAGAYMGTLSALPLSGEIATWFGWRTIFWAYGSVGMAWCTTWWIVVYDSPAQHPSITDAEQQYITSSLQEEELCQSLTSEHKEEQKTNLSWQKVISSGQIWLIVVLSGFNTYGFYVWLSDLPSYLSSVLGFSVEEAGRTALFPYLAILVATPSFGALADFLQTPAVGLRPVTVRRILQATSMLLPSCCLLFINLVHPGKAVTVAVVIAAVGSCGAFHSGVPVHCYEVGGARTGLIYAIMNTASQVPGIVAPYVTGLCVQHYGSQNGYAVVFWICIALYVAGASLWVVLLSGEHIDIDCEATNCDVDQETQDSLANRNAKSDWQITNPISDGYDPVFGHGVARRNGDIPVRGHRVAG